MVISSRGRSVYTRTVSRWAKVFLLLTSLVVVSLLGVVAINAWVSRVAQPWLFDDLSSLPSNRVGVVLGTSPRLVDGQPNLYFTYRVQAAARLYEAGKVEYLLVSGDNSSQFYNEPLAMREALEQLGVPRERIYLDYAGLRTLDVVRTKEVFQEQRFTVISQRFHNERAVFIARERGLEAVGFDARGVSRRSSPMVYIREYFARVQMVLDLFVLKTNPKYLGEPIRIGVDPIQ